jgi:hypothetical protein
MPTAYSWSENLPRVALDQRSREAHLRLERIERQLAPRAAVPHYRLMRLLWPFASAGAALRRDGTGPEDG